MFICILPFFLKSPNSQYFQHNIGRKYKATDKYIYITCRLGLRQTGVEGNIDGGHCCPHLPHMLAPILCPCSGQPFSSSYCCTW